MLQFSNDNSTICALSTPPGVGAIGVIRVSGPDAISMCDHHFSGQLTDAPGYTIRYGRFIHNDHVIDDVLIAVFRAPKSFTGEDVVEISCHGSAYIRQEILRVLIGAGCRSARQGEFTFRAFMNGKMDLSQAEAVADLIAAESEGAHRLAMHQMRGGFSNEIGALRQQLIDFASLIELELDFAEEDVTFADRHQFNALLTTLDAMLTRLIESFRTGNAIKNGVPVAIVGKPNAGKSTLLNALLNEERAIVSDIPGTTRDTVEDSTVLGGIRFRFIDTAGLRETDDVIEKIGVARSKGAMQQSAVIIYLFDVAEVSPEALGETLRAIRADATEAAHLLVVGNKIDARGLPKGYPEDTLFISARERENLDALVARLLAASEVGDLDPDSTVVTNLRHFEALSKAQEALQEVQNGLVNGLSGDFLAIDIRRALHYLGEITGEISTDDLLGNIFGKFCIGK
jgi:tRNA modification GTPase